MQDTSRNTGISQAIPDLNPGGRTPAQQSPQQYQPYQAQPSQAPQHAPAPEMQQPQQTSRAAGAQATRPAPYNPAPRQQAPRDSQPMQRVAQQQPQSQSQQWPQGQPQVRRGGNPVIVFDNVTKQYPEQTNHPALMNVSLAVYPGEFVFLVGHSGSGKSTFIRLLTRELTPTSGRLLVAGEDLSAIRKWRVPYLRRNIGCVFQDFKLLPNKTAFENVAFALEVIGKSKHVINTQVPEVLRLVGLEEKMDKRPDQLSGGEQQRVSIARAIVNRPPLLICDEPTGNLDPQTSLGIMRLLDRINRTGTTILVATHDREMVDSMRRRVIALDEGHLVRDENRGAYGQNA